MLRIIGCLKKATDLIPLFTEVTEDGQRLIFGTGDYVYYDTGDEEGDPNVLLIEKNLPEVKKIAEEFGYLVEIKTETIEDCDKRSPAYSKEERHRIAFSPKGDHK